MSSPKRSFQVEKISMLRSDKRIFAGSEWVARMPPIARLLEDWPMLGAWSITRTLKPACARKNALGVPTEPAPMMITSKWGMAVLVIGVILLSIGACQDAERHFHEYRPLRVFGDLLPGDALLAEQPQNQINAGFPTAGAHAGPRDGFDLVHVAVTRPDEPSNFTGGDVLAAAYDGVVLDVRHIMVERVGHFLVLDLDSGDALGVLRRGIDLDHQGPVIVLDGMHREHLHLTEFLAFRVEHADLVIGFDHLTGELIWDGNHG